MQYLFNHSGILERISYAPARKTYCPVFDCSGSNIGGG